MSFIRELIEKQAALRPEIKLDPHQQSAVDVTGNNTIFAHPTGSGKTLTGIAKFEKLKETGDAKKALVVVPSSLRDNFSNEGVKKFTDSSYNIIGTKEEIRKRLASNVNPNADYNIISYDLFRKNPDAYVEESGADTIILDENHRTKNEETMTAKAFESKLLRDRIQNVIGLTGSITSNTPADMVPLVNIASRGAADIGKSKAEFLDRYALRDSSRAFKGVADARKPIVGFKNKKHLQDQLMNYIHFMDTDEVREIADMPDKDLNVVKVPITGEQKALYKKMLKNDPKLRKMIIDKRFETLKDEEASMAFSKLSEMRKLMNDPSSVIKTDIDGSPKLERMVDDLEVHLNKNPNGQAILLSHLINGGINSIEDELKERGLSYDKFVGKGNAGVTEESRQKAVRDYNDRLNRILLISGAGGEGLSLNDTTFEGVLDPHFNPEKMQQMEARGIRRGGLSYLPKEDRSVMVNRYLATMPKTLGIFKSPLLTPDEAIYAIAQKKERQNKVVHEMLKNVRKQQEAAYLKKNASIVSDTHFYSDTIEKLASIDKLRKKRYWQYLKRLHGGNDEAVDYLVRTKDPGIYRATSGERSSLENGIASRPQPTAFAANKGVFVGEGEFVKKYYYKPVENNTYPTGGDLLLRLKYPSELEGKAIYPKSSKVVRVDRPDTSLFGKKINPRVMTNIERDQVFRGKNFEDEFTHHIFDNQMIVRDDLPANILKKASDASDAFVEEIIEDRVVPYAKNYATGSLPGQMLGWGLGGKFIKAPNTGNKVVDLGAKAGAVALAGSIGGSLGRGLNRAVSLDHEFDQELDRNPSVEDFAKSVPVAMIPFLGGAVATPEAIVRKIKEDETMGEKKATLIGGMIEKRAVDEALEKALATDVEKKVAEMMANSHEYKKPNIQGALVFVKNYTWEERMIPLSRLQGINKPIKKEKVYEIARTLEKNGDKVEWPFIVVNKLHGIRPQTHGKVILMDGHHRMEACKARGIKEVPVYFGTYTGGAEIEDDELYKEVPNEKVAFTLAEKAGFALGNAVDILTGSDLKHAKMLKGFTDESLERAEKEYQKIKSERMFKRKDLDLKNMMKKREDEANTAKRYRDKGDSESADLWDKEFTNFYDRLINYHFDDVSRNFDAQLYFKDKMNKALEEAMVSNKRVNKEKAKMIGAYTGSGIGITGTGIGVHNYLAKKKQNESNEKVAQVGDSDFEKALIPQLGLASSALLAGKSADALLGQKTLYHGTTKENASKIKQEGLLASKGGFGGSSDAHPSELIRDIFKSRSSGLVHATAVPEVAEFFAEYASGGAPSEFPVKKVSKKGEVLKIKIPYEDFMNMEIDEDVLGGNDKPSSLKNKSLREIGVKTNKDINVESIAGKNGVKRLKRNLQNMPSYIKNNPRRFATGAAGVGLAGIIAGLSGKGIDDFADMVNERNLNENEKTAADYSEKLKKLRAEKDPANFKETPYGTFKEQCKKDEHSFVYLGGEARCSKCGWFISPSGKISKTASQHSLEKIAEEIIEKKIVTQDDLYTVARIVHEINRHYNKLLMDREDPSWDELDEKDQANRISLLSETVPDIKKISAKKMHDMWVDQQAKEGWVYGDVYDSKKKTHPCIVSWKDLPDLEKAKDAMYLSVIKSMTELHFGIDKTINSKIKEIQIPGGEKVLMNKSATLMGHLIEKQAGMNRSDLKEIKNTPRQNIDIFDENSDDFVRFNRIRGANYDNRPFELEDEIYHQIRTRAKKDPLAKKVVAAEDSELRRLVAPSLIGLIGGAVGGTVGGSKLSEALTSHIAAVSKRKGDDVIRDLVGATGSAALTLGGLTGGAVGGGRLGASFGKLISPYAYKGVTQEDFDAYNASVEKVRQDDLPRMVSKMDGRIGKEATLNDVLLLKYAEMINQPTIRNTY